MLICARVTSLRADQLRLDLRVGVGDVGLRGLELALRGLHDLVGEQHVDVRRAVSNASWRRSSVLCAFCPASECLA